MIASLNDPTRLTSFPELGPMEVTKAIKFFNGYDPLTMKLIGVPKVGDIYFCSSHRPHLLAFNMRKVIPSVLTLTLIPPKYDEKFITLKQRQNIDNITSPYIIPISIFSAATGSNFVEQTMTAQNFPQYKIYNDFSEPFFLITYASFDATLHWEVKNSFQVPGYRQPKEYQCAGSFRIHSYTSTIHRNDWLATELAERVNYKAKTGVLSKVILPGTPDVITHDEGAPIEPSYLDAIMDDYIKKFNYNLVIQADESGVIKPERWHCRCHTYLELALPLLTPTQPFLGAVAVAIDHIPGLSVARWQNYLACHQRNNYPLPSPEFILGEYTHHDSATESYCQPEWFHDGAPKSIGSFLAKCMAREWERERRARGDIVTVMDSYSPANTDLQLDSSQEPLEFENDVANEKLAKAIRALNMARAEIKNQAAHGDPLAQSMVNSHLEKKLAIRETRLLQQRLLEEPQHQPFRVDLTVLVDHHSDTTDSTMASVRYAAKRHSPAPLDASEMQGACAKRSNNFDRSLTPTTGSEGDVTADTSGDPPTLHYVDRTQSVSPPESFQYIDRSQSGSPPEPEPSKNKHNGLQVKFNHGSATPSGPLATSSPPSSMPRHGLIMTEQDITALDGLLALSTVSSSPLGSSQLPTGNDDNNVDDFDPLQFMSMQLDALETEPEVNDFNPNGDEASTSRQRTLSETDIDIDTLV
jgi:hypothetical protein